MAAGGEPGASTVFRGGKIYSSTRTCPRRRRSQSPTGESLRSGTKRSTFVEKQERDPCERIYDLLPALKDEDPSRYREIPVATLTDEERELCQKMFAGPRGSSSSPARPAVKSLTPALSRNGHEGQLPSPDGRWRTSLFRRITNVQPRVRGRFFP